MKIELTEVLKTKHYYLRAPDLADIPYIFSAAKVKGFTDGILWEPPKSEEDLIRPYQKNIEAWIKGEGYSFSIVEKGSNLFLGRISIRKTKELRRWNVGFWTHPSMQRKGVMTEVLARILKFGFEVLEAERIEAYYATWNKASEKVLKRNGMQFVCYIQKGFQKNGHWVAENLLEISVTQWLEQNA